MSPTLTDRLAILEDLHLQKGGGNEADKTMCVMQAVAYVAGETWTDAPECASTVISAFLRNWNDSLTDEDRDRLLKPLIPLLVDTRGSDEVESRRAWMAVDWLARVQAPAWLDLAGLTDHATALRGCDELHDANSALKAKSIQDAARDAAWDAARAAARDAARAAARDAVAPTVAILQESALDLVHRMIAVTK